MPTLSTDAVPERKRFDYWRDLVSKNLLSVRIDCTTNGPFFGNLRSCEIGSSKLLYVNSTSQCVARTEQRVSHDRKDLYLLNYLHSGHGRITQHGNFQDLGAGDFFFHDSASTGTLELMSDFSMITLSLSRARIDRHFANAQYLCALPLSTTASAAGRVAADLLQSVAMNCQHMTGETLDGVVESLVRLVAVAYGVPSAPRVSTCQSAFLMRLRDYILVHLADEALSPKSIAADHKISSRYLSKLFEAEGTTVSRWIWMQRLEAARRTLCRPEFANLKINEVAYRCGFNDMSHFSFSFRKRFGSTPREYRSRTLATSPAARAEGADTSVLCLK
jgi:AraC family transcriptional regulator, positive regulator of tynA and feaB